MNRENLRALAKFLREVVQPAQFDMKNFGGPKGDMFTTWQPYQIREKHKGCGTVACAIGHAPFLFPGKPDETWTGYSFRVFGLREFSEAWSWIFSADWERVDNTPAGAAARIDYLLDKGLPDDWEAQSVGEADLCYSR